VTGLPSTGQISWVPAGGPNWARRSEIGFLLCVTAISVLFVTISPQYTPWEDPLGLIMFWVFGAVGVVLLGTMEVTRLGLSDSGIILERWVGTRRFSWTLIQPLFLRPTRQRLILECCEPGIGKYPLRVILSRAQAKALLNHPFAPRWPIPAGVMDRLFPPLPKDSGRDPPAD
jgi:hypothetical protein